MSDLEALRVEVESLQVVTRALAARVHRCEDWIDTVSSPWWKRVWFVAQGFRWHRLGRWRGPDRRGWPD